MMWSLWTMGEDYESQDETDFKPEGRQGSGKSFSPALRDQKENKGSTGYSMLKKEHTDVDRRGSCVESSSWGSGRASTGARGTQRKNSETIFNLEY